MLKKSQSDVLIIYESIFLKVYTNSKFVEMLIKLSYIHDKCLNSWISV